MQLSLQNNRPIYNKSCQAKIGFHGSAGREKVRVKESAPQKACSDILLDENDSGIFQCRKLRSNVPDKSGI